MSRIDLPPYHWFLSKHEEGFVANAYSGSLGTFPEQGCVSTRTFNYRVYVDISSGDESNFCLIAERYIIQPWNSDGNMTDFERVEFESSEKGVADAEVWIVQTAAKCGF